MLLLWPQTGSLSGAIEALVPMPPEREAPPILVPPVTRATARRAAATRRTRGAPPSFAPAPALPPLGMPPPEPARYAVPEPPPASGPARQPHLVAPIRIDRLPDRWSASGWFVARAGRGIGAAPGGQLGGGQAGLRIAYVLAPRKRIAAFARVTAPLAGQGREAAVGLEWQPDGAPFRLVAEQRFGLDGAPGGTGLGTVAGMDMRVGGLHLEGYGQAGMIARRRIEPYADGAIRLTRPPADRGGGLTLGAGAWAGAQRGAQRLDIGPSAILALGNIRIALDWRQRIAGRARPGSGLALTLGGDF